MQRNGVVQVSGVFGVLVFLAFLHALLSLFVALHCSQEGQQRFSGAQQPVVLCQLCNQHKAQLCPCHTEATAPCRRVLFHWCPLMPVLGHGKDPWPCQQVTCLTPRGNSFALPVTAGEGPSGSVTSRSRGISSTQQGSEASDHHAPKEPSERLSPPEGLRGSTRGWEWVVLSRQARWWGERGRAAAAVTALLPAPLLLMPFLPPGFFPDSQHHHPKVSLEEGICLLVCLFIICLIRGRTEKKSHKQSACLFLFPALFPLPPFSSCC